MRNPSIPALAASQRRPQQTRAPKARTMKCRAVHFIVEEADCKAAAFLCTSQSSTRTRVLFLVLTKSSPASHNINRMPKSASHASLGMLYWLASSTPVLSDRCRHATFDERISNRILMAALRLKPVVQRAAFCSQGRRSFQENGCSSNCRPLLCK